MKIHFLIILLSIGFLSTAQNLVTNGNFEKYSLCPDKNGQINRLIDWFGFGSCEYFNICDSTKKVGVPYNKWGFAKSYISNGYIGHAFFTSDEFSSTKLKNELIIGKKYCVSIAVQLVESSSYAIKEIGIYFSPDTLKWSELLADTISPQFLNTKGIISDTMNWTLLSGEFNALGGEQFITIGNFYRYRQFTFQFLPYGITNGHSYYYIDGVAVYPCDDPISSAQTIKDTILCLDNSISPGLTHVESQYKAEYEWLWYKAGKPEDTLSTKEFPVFYPDTTTTYVLKLTDFKYDVTFDTVTVTVVDCKTPTVLKVFPNPTNDNINFEFNSTIPEDISIEIHNVMGQKIKGMHYLSSKETNSLELNLQTQSSGIYFYRVIMGNDVLFNGKLIKL